MRKITEIILHCTATPEGRDVTAAEVNRWHKARGFLSIGYHYLIRLDGTVEEGRPLSQQGAHCLQHNANSIGVCYAGGLTKDGKQPKDTRTKAQRNAMRMLVDKLKQRFPGATVHCHNEYAPKACPCFSMKDF